MTATIAPPVHDGHKIWKIIQRWDWLILVAIAPVIFFVEARWAVALLVLPLILVIEALAWGDLLPITPLNPAILLLTVMVGVSIIVTPDLSDSLGKIAGVLFGIIVYYCVVRHTRTKEGFKGSLVLLALAGLGLATIGLVGTNWLTVKIIGLNTLTARLPMLLRGLPGAVNGIHPYELAGALLWIIPVLFVASVALLNEPDWFLGSTSKVYSDFKRFLAWTLFLLVVLLIDLGVFILTQSRGGYLAILLTGLMLMIMIPRRKARWWAIGLLAVIMIGCAIIVWQFGWKNITDQMLSSLPMDSSNFSVLSLDWRVETWSRAVWAIKDVPLTGLGMNIFRSAVGMLYPTFQFSAANDLAHAHNELLQAAVDLGLPGLVAFLALYVGAIGMLISAVRSKGAWRLLALGLLGGLFAHFIFGVTDTVALGAKPGFLFWWLLGMVCGLYHQTRMEATG